MELLKAAPEELAKFVNFIADFAGSPRTALQPYATAPPRVQGDLFLFCALGVGCATLMMTIGQALGMAEDRSWIVGVFSGFDAKLLPLAVAIVIVALSAVWHGLTRLVGSVAGRLYPDLRFDGAIKNSINAGFAFTAFYVPILSAALVAVRLGAAHASLSWIFAFIAALALSVAFVVYFVLAFAALHQVRAGGYYFLCCVTVVPLFYLAELVG